jgi:hypothetical protein
VNLLRMNPCHSSNASGETSWKRMTVGLVPRAR